MIDNDEARVRIYKSDISIQTIFIFTEKNTPFNHAVFNYIDAAVFNRGYTTI